MGVVAVGDLPPLAPHVQVAELVGVEHAAVLAQGPLAERTADADVPAPLRARMWLRAVSRIGRGMTSSALTPRRSWRIRRTSLSSSPPMTSTKLLMYE